MKATNPWITYRTRFLVKARQLTTSLAFTDDLGRFHSGRKGDYLVESTEGVLSIAPRQIFEDIYVPLSAGESALPDNPSQAPAKPPYLSLLPEEASRPRGTQLPSGTLRRRESAVPLSLPAHLTRKSPQPYRDRRTLSLGARFI